jgi:hypothetical protein
MQQREELRRSCESRRACHNQYKMRKKNLRLSAFSGRVQAASCAVHIYMYMALMFGEDVQLMCKRGEEGSRGELSRTTVTV